jgi:hypothetical protein
MTNDPVAPEPRLIVVCDASVLYSITMADLLTSRVKQGCIIRDGHTRFTTNGIAI